jgi:hypothetical protein
MTPSMEIVYFFEKREVKLPIKQSSKIGKHRKKHPEKYQKCHSKIDMPEIYYSKYNYESGAQIKCGLPPGASNLGIPIQIFSMPEMIH